MAMTRQQLEQQLVAAHRTKNVQAAQQAAYAIRAYDQNVLSAQVPSINAPPPIDRVPKPTFGSYIEDISRGMGRGFVTQMEGMQQLVTHPYDTGKALIQAGVEAVRNPSQAIGEAWSGIKSQAQTAMSSPQGFGQVLGENLDFIPGPGGKRRPTMAELDVYHGTPHTFDPEEGAPLGRFRSEKIGTGEGAQAYGYGLYFAESPGVAKSYKDKLTPSAAVPNAAANSLEKMNPNLYARLERIAKESGYTVSAINRMVVKPNEFREIDAALKREILDFKKSAKGALYKVDLPDAKIEQMLDWDKPFLDQSQAVKDLAKSKLPPGVYQGLLTQRTGDLVEALAVYGGGKAKASELLRQAGIPGIKYLDAGSRAGEKGTRNFVVFPGEEQSLTILERN